MGREHESLAAASGLLTLRTTTATWENRNMRNQGQAESVKLRGGQASAGTGARVPGEEEGSTSAEAAAAWVGRRGRRERLTATGRAAMAMESMVERPSGGATANDDERVWRTEESSKTRSGGGDTDTNAKIFLGP